MRVIHGESGRAMPGLDVQATERPGEDEIRAALEHMAASEAFRGSPQLVAFLRYVVEETLRGASDRIKGYTIAVEALGRAADFDPQADPIVRVEAMRLRRALGRYYANSGKADLVVIDLPLGSYVPMFRRAAPLRPAEEVLPQTPAAPVAPSAAGELRRRADGWRRAAAALAFALMGAAVYAGLDFWFDFNTPKEILLAAHAPAAGSAWRDPPAYPVVFVGAIQRAAGNGDLPPVDMLRGKLRDVLARFDEIQVVAATPRFGFDARTADEKAPASGYDLTASVQSESPGRMTISIRLTDAGNGRVVYARGFDQVRQDGGSVPSDEAIAHEVAAALAQPYGIIQAYERSKESSDETQYRCLTEAYDYWRTYDPQQHRRARECLERTITATPAFALGHAALSMLMLEEYRGVVAAPAAAPPALQRALHAARRAVELRPGSARAHQALSEVQFARGDYPLAIEAGERARMLNPYDPSILADLGAHLLAAGEQERGLRLLREAAAVNVVRPARQDFFLFLGAYLAGDPAGAARYAALMTSDTYPLGVMARALVAARRGEADHARHLLDHLATFCPAWRDDSRGELRKYFSAGPIVDRISRDLAQIALAHSQ
jgi:tetratricopeptide (TPR) repeat protein